MVTDPPKVFSQPVVLCPSCGHGIDPHGLDPGGRCGVGDENRVLCECLWSPNDIAAVSLADERERIAQAIEQLGHHPDCAAIEPMDEGVDYGDPRGRMTGEPCDCGIHAAARIARDGGRDE